MYNINGCCQTCAHLGFDSCMDGYCGCENCGRYKMMVVNDKGCKIVECVYYEKAEVAEKETND